MHLSLSSRTLDLTTPVVMGVLNLTPDSFSDAGRFQSEKAATKAALHMVEAGASIIDIGGESTRPGSSPISSQIQLDRVLPVIEAIRRESATIISIDTSHPQVMREATAAGAEIINDIFALTQPGAMHAAAATNAETRTGANDRRYLGVIMDREFVGWAGRANRGPASYLVW